MLAVVPAVILYDWLRPRWVTAANFERVQHAKGRGEVEAIVGRPDLVMIFSFRPNMMWYESELSLRDSFAMENRIDLIIDNDGSVTRPVSRGLK